MHVGSLQGDHLLSNERENRGSRSRLPGEIRAPQLTSDDFMDDLPASAGSERRYAAIHVAFWNLGDFYGNGRCPPQWG